MEWLGPLVLVGWAIVWLVTLGEILRWRDETFSLAGQNRLAWFFVVFFFQFFVYVA